MADKVKPLKLPAAPLRQQIENKHLWNEARSSKEADFFTIGYTGKPIEIILQLLEANGVKTLVDIRQNPVSMYRPELTKVNLQKAVAKRGIHYAHVPKLGVPRDIRAKAMDTGSRAVIWEWYDQHVVKPYIQKNMHWFLNGNEHPVALMCVELDPKDCHRHRLFLALEDMGLRGYDL
jgi:uncharacterized protein (DUF488 family)